MIKYQYYIARVAWHLVLLKSGRHYAELVDGVTYRPLRWTELNGFKRRAKAAYIRRLRNARTGRL